MVDYKFHDVASLFPLMEGKEFADFVEDIKKSGLREPIWLYNGKIIDGRNRYNACKKAGIKLLPKHFKKWGGADSLISFIISLNLKRRHLTPSQIACAAVDALPFYEAEAKERQLRKPNSVSPLLDEQKGRADAFAAADFKVSRGYIAAAKALTKRERDQVKKGKKTLSQATRKQKEDKQERERKKDQAKVKKTKPLKTTTKFSTIVIDPPWDFDDEGDKNQFGRAKPEYATMPIEKIEKLPIQELSATNCHLYLWITNRSLPKGFSLIEKWGFRYITCLTWCKPSIGMGNYFRGATEQILFAVKGSLPLKRKDVGTWFEATRGKKHSEKPDKAFELIESCSPGPYLEMFARKKRSGWESWGAGV